MLRASRSMRVTIRTSSLRRKSSTVRSSSRPAVVVPLRFSDLIISHPAARRAFSRSSRFWSVVLTRNQMVGSEEVGQFLKSKACLKGVGKKTL